MQHDVEASRLLQEKDLSIHSSPEKLYNINDQICNHMLDHIEDIFKNVSNTNDTFPLIKETINSDKIIGRKSLIKNS